MKLDLFHAVQRITKTISKKHAHAMQCFKELSLVFRKDGDIGDKRLFSTPQPDQLEKNLDKFIQKWQKTDHTLFKPETISAFKWLKQHITYVRVLI